MAYLPARCLFCLAVWLQGKVWSQLEITPDVHNAVFAWVHYRQVCQPALLPCPPARLQACMPYLSLACRSFFCVSLHHITCHVRHLRQVCLGACCPQIIPTPPGATASTLSVLAVCREPGAAAAGGGQAGHPAGEAWSPAAQERRQHLASAGHQGWVRGACAACCTNSLPPDRAQSALQWHRGWGVSLGCRAWAHCAGSDGVHVLRCAVDATACPPCIVCSAVYGWVVCACVSICRAAHHSSPGRSWPASVAPCATCSATTMPTWMSHG